MPESSALRAKGPAATFDDVRACYRLLLGREPDTGGLEHYRARVGAGQLSVADLVGEFIGSVEFARAHPAPRGAPGPTEVVSTVEGFRLHVDPTDYAVGHTVARTGAYEPHVCAALRSVLGRDATFVDVGANIGWFSMLGASLVGRGGRVVAIEPNPLNVALAQRSAAENGFGNVEVLAVALAEQPQAVALETDGSNGRVIPIDGPPEAPVPASFVVPAYPLDDVLERLDVGRVDVMKIDVEGAEPLVIRGAARTLKDSLPVLISEFYPLALDSSPWGSARAYLDMLRGLGYELSVIGHDGADNATDDMIMALAAAPGEDHVDLLARPGRGPAGPGR